MITARESNPDFVSRLNSRFGELLATARKRRDMSQTALAEQVGLSRATIANLELGKQNVQLSQIFLLADALNENPANLLPSIEGLQPGPAQEADAFLQLVRLRLNSLLAVHA